MSPEQLAHPPGAAAQRRLDLLARGPRTQALECIRHGDAARIQECECRRQLRREHTKVRLRRHFSEPACEVSRIVETPERKRGERLRDQPGAAEIPRRAGCQHLTQRHGSPWHVERRQQSRSGTEIGAASGRRLACCPLRDSDCGALGKKAPGEPHLEQGAEPEGEGVQRAAMPLQRIERIGGIRRVTFRGRNPCEVLPGGAKVGTQPRRPFQRSDRFCPAMPDQRAAVEQFVPKLKPTQEDVARIFRGGAQRVQPRLLGELRGENKAPEQGR